MAVCRGRSRVFRVGGRRARRDVEARWVSRVLSLVDVEKIFLHGRDADAGLRV